MSRTILGGRYELVSPAGVGGVASVWKGLAHGEGGFVRTVAIKRLLPWAAENPSAVAMFIEEARIVSELTHPHIVQVLDYCREEDDRHAIIMEWVEGIDLARYLKAHVERGEQVPWPYVAKIVSEIASALHAAHSRVRETGEPAPVYHRDVTPANIVVGVSGIAKLTDFGMARATDRVTGTQPGVLKGKLAYMAPEYVNGMPANPQTEIYSLGVVLWEALAGRRLRPGGDPTELLAAAAKAVPPLADQRPDLPAALLEVVSRAVALEPSSRHPTARAMAAALRQVLRTVEEVDEHAIVESVRQALGLLTHDTELEPPEESGEWPQG